MQLTNWINVHGRDPEGEIMDDKLRKVTVCDRCFTASCWHYEFVCDNFQGAGLIDLPVWILDRLDLEHRSHYSVEKIKCLTGGL